MDARQAAKVTGEQPALSAADSTCRSQGLPRYQPLVTVIIAIAVGIAFDRYGHSVDIGNAPAGVSWFALWWLLAAMALLVWWFAWRARRTALAAWPLLFAAAFAGAAWHHAQWHLFGRYDCSRYAALDLAPVCVEAIARETPQRMPAPQPTPLRAIPSGERTRLHLEVYQIRDGTNWRPASGDCRLVIEGQLLGVHPGDRLRIFGQFSRIRPPLNPGEFDFAAHARADGELVRIRSSAPESITIISKAGHWRIERLMNAIRDGARRLVHDFVGPERADLACAILLGAREGLTPEELGPYLLTGTVHVLVVSGMNVAVLAAGLYMFMRLGWLSRRAGLSMIIVVVVGYALVTEFQPPVIRAAIFAVLVCLGSWSGRSGIPFNSLAAAALFVLALNSADLFRAGPQLSFLAVAALISIGNQGGLVSIGPSEWVERMFAVDRPWYVRSLARWGRTFGWLGRPPDRLEQMIAAARPWYTRTLAGFGGTIGWLLFASLVVWLVTLPLLLNQFHIASPVSILISPVLWIVVFFTMWSGFFMLAVGWLLPAMGAWFGAACNLSLDALEQLVNGAEHLPGGHFFAPGPAWWWVLAFYVALLAAMVHGRAWIAPRWQLAALSMWIVIGLAPPVWRATQRDSLECSFVAVGHGACVLLESPNGETLLCDAGSLGSPEYATQTIASYLWSRGIMRLDGIIISHADIDHYNAVPGLLQRFAVGTVYVSPMMFDGFDDGTTRGPQVLLEAIRVAKVPIREVWSGDRLRLGHDTTLHVFHPPRQGVLGSDNANSITLAVEHAGRRLLLPGDLETPGIEDVMAELPYDCDVLLAPHHGSRRSDPPGFAVWSTPNWVVISGSASADVRPVVQTYERAGANVMHTNELGLIHFSLGNGPIRIATWRITPKN